jgi:hypothetical protein
MLHEIYLFVLLAKRTPSKLYASDMAKAETDVESDLAFMNQQKELRSLYRGFRETIDTIRQGSQDATGIADGDGSDESDGIRTDAARLLSEIKHMQRETDEIIRLIARPKFAKYSRVQRIKRQLLNLQKINSHLHTRAEALLSVD